ncbi:MAG: hypothetical protein H0V82_09860 [Candidatus Protochlamydia sp.]|nr:hypothetical protein [Candidatus Protochlamydia sp.]
MQTITSAFNPSEDTTLQPTILLPENEYVYFFLQDIFLTFRQCNFFQAPHKGIKVTPINLKEAAAENIFKAGRMICVLFQNKQITYILIHPIWLKKVNEEKNHEFLQIADLYFHTERKNFLELNENSYNFIFKNFREKKF